MARKFYLCAASAIAIAMPALAQTAAGDMAQAGTDIVVTAQKREERLIDVPQSMTAVSSDYLARLNATQLRDFTTTVPALTVTSSGVGQGQITLRGVTAGTDVGPTVGIYVNDVPYGSSSAFAGGASLALDAGLFDLDRVEVLRGPQGTLYGASSMGGVLKYVTRQPNLRAFEGLVQAGLSSTRYGGINYNAGVALNAPIVADKIAIRASGFYNHDAGAIDNLTLNQKDVDRSRVYGGRVDLLLKPAEDLSVWLSAFGQNIHRDGTAVADYTLAGAPVNGDLDQRRVAAEPFDSRFRLVSGTINYDFGPAALTSVTSYQTNRVSFINDVSAVYVPLLGSLGLNFGSTPFENGRSTNKFTQEIRLASTGHHFIEWLIGGFYTREKSNNFQHLLPTTVGGAPSPVNLATLSLPSIYREIAGFGNVTVHLTDQLDISGGVRVSRNNQSYTQNGTGILVGSVPTTKSRDTVATYLANVRYKFSDRATVYARFATGYRPGGPNAVARDPLSGAFLAPPTFASDSLNSYEAGFKGETADRTFGIDVAGYHIDWKNMQVPTAVNGLSVIANANSAKIDGAELTLTARPSRTFTVTGAFAYQDARLAEASPALGGRKGEAVPNVPKWSAAVNADYVARGENLRPTAGATLRFVSNRKASFDLNGGFPQFNLGDYVTLDLRAGATIATVDLQVYLRNAFDSRGKLSAVTALSILGGPANVAIVQPRTIGISATKRF